MAFLKYAHAAVVKPSITMAGWDEVRATAMALEEIAVHIMKGDGRGQNH